MNKNELRWLDYAHLPPHLQQIVKPFFELAARLTVDNIDGVRHVNEREPLLKTDNAERSAMIRKLIEAKDCAVRAALLDRDTPLSPEVADALERYNTTRANGRTGHIVGD